MSSGSGGRRKGIQEVNRDENVDSSGKDAASNAENFTCSQCNVVTPVKFMVVDKICDYCTEKDSYGNEGLEEDGEYYEDY